VSASRANLSAGSRFCSSAYIGTSGTRALPGFPLALFLFGNLRASAAELPRIPTDEGFRRADTWLGASQQRRTPSEFHNPGKYRRAFDSRVSTPNCESLGTELQAMASRSRSDLLDMLEDFLDISRRRLENRTAISKLQLWMMQEIVFQEAVIKRGKRRLSEISLPSPDAKVAAEIEEIKREMFLFMVYANALRAIGDTGRPLPPPVPAAWLRLRRRSSWKTRDINRTVRR
jgi:hypothetical protein